MSSEKIVENKSDTSNPRLELNLCSADGDSNANSTETLTTAAGLVLMAKTPQDRERALEKILTQTEASEAASDDPSSHGAPISPAC